MNMPCDKSVLLVPNSMSSVKVKYQVLNFSKNGRFGGIHVSQTHLLFDRVQNTVGKGENAGYQHFLLLPQGFLQLSSIGSSKVGLTPSQTGPRLLRVCITGLLKTIWEKEKLLVTLTIIFSFLYIVFGTPSIHIIIWVILEPFLKHQIFDASKMKEFADNNFKYDENGRIIFRRVENTLGKGEIARNEQFLHFQMF